jgi:hypothetical protein
VIDVLDVVAIIQHVHELFECGQIVLADLGGCLRDERYFLDFQIDFRKRFLQHLLGFLKLAGRGEQRQLTILAFDIVDINVGFQHGFQNLVFVVPFEGQHCQVIKQVGDGTGRS